MGILHYIMFLGQGEVQDLLIYLYGQRYDIYCEGKDNIFGEGHMYSGSMYKAINYSQTYNI